MEEEQEKKPTKRLKLNFFYQLPTVKSIVKEEEKKVSTVLGWRTIPRLGIEELFAGGNRKTCAIDCIATMLGWKVSFFFI